MIRLLALSLALAAEPPAPPPDQPATTPPAAQAPAPVAAAPKPPLESGPRPPFAQYVEQPPRPTSFTPRATAPVPKPAPRYEAHSVFDASGPGPKQVAVAVALGFPYAVLRGGYGINDRVQAGLAFNSFYSLVNQVAVFGKLRVFGDRTDAFAFAVRLDAETAFFRETAAADGQHGSRWLTGQRDFSLAPGLVLSTRTARGLAFWLDVGAQITFDTHPLSAGPLTGAPSAFTPGANAPLRLGVDLPLAESVSFLTAFGVDLHFRKDDSPAMPYIAIGVTFGG